MERRGEQLTQQLQQRRLAAEANISKLLTATSLVAAAGEHLSARVAEAGRSDGHAFLAEAPRVAELFVDAESRLVALGRLVAENQPARVCISLQPVTADKAAIIDSVAKVGDFVTQSIAADNPQSAGASRGFRPSPREIEAALERLQSAILQSAHYPDLKHFFGRMQVGRSKATAVEFTRWQPLCSPLRNVSSHLDV